jgi:hypothetical protein
MVDEHDVPNDSDYISSPPSNGNTLTIELRQSATLIKQWTVNPTALETNVLALTAGERAAISDWTALAVWVSVNGGANIAKLKLDNLTTPQAGGGTLYIRARSSQ